MIIGADAGIIKAYEAITKEIDRGVIIVQSEKSTIAEITQPPSLLIKNYHNPPLIFSEPVKSKRNTNKRPKKKKRKK